MKGELTFISAGAGSGKTHRLTNLLYERLAAGQAQPSGVIATTFTRKAAAELRERTRALLLEKGRFDLASAMEDALINTVNGLCQNLLQRFCFEAGMSPELRVLEEQDAARVLKECVELALDEEKLQRLHDISVRMGIEDWKNDLSSIVSAARANDIEIGSLKEFAERNAAELLAFLPTPTQADLDADIKKAIDEQRTAFEAAVATSTVKQAKTGFDEIDAFRRDLEYGHCRWSSWAKMVGANAGRALDGFTAPIREIAQHHLNHSRLHTDLRDYITLVFEGAAVTLQSYAERKRELGVLDFTDQEALLLKALDNPAISATLADELDLLLVDEFQDTSPIQLALFMKLTALAKETYWVGDVKQSIYGFRSSDSQLMESVIAALPKMGGTTEVLDQSWRSRPALVELVNEVFAKVFDNIPESQVKLKPQRREQSADAAYAVWHLGGKKIALRMEALALEVRRLLESGYKVVDKESKSLRAVRPADIAILCRGNDRVDVVLDALAKAGVPYATGAAGLLRCPESVLALACLRRLHDSGDTIATAEILSLADCAEPEQWLADRLAHLAQSLPKAEWREVGDGAHPLLARIASIRKELALLSPREAIERVIGGCDLVPRILRWCSSEAEARQRVANVDALLALAAAYEDSCRATGKPGSVSGLMRWFDDQAEAEKDQQPTLAADAVQVLTHHAAKGLEWPIVILVDLDCETRDRFWGISVRSDRGLDVMAPLAGRFIQFRPWPFGKTTKVPLRDLAANSAAGEVARKAAADEDARLLYVSMTRARDLTIVALPKVEWNDEQWLGLTGATWLLPKQDHSGALRFPANRQLWRFQYCEPASEGQAPAKKQAISLHWFVDVATVGNRPALHFSPSSAEPITFAPPMPEFIGKSITLAPGYDSATVGTALHAAMAVSLGPSGPLSREEIAALFERYQVGGGANPDEVYAFAVAFREWLMSRYPSAVITAEVPVRSRMNDGRIMAGQIDLLLQIGSNKIILDYKSGQLLPDKPSVKLQHYAGQLKAYADAVQGAGEVRTYLVSTNEGLVLECRPQGKAA